MESFESWKRRMEARIQQINVLAQEPGSAFLDSRGYEVLRRLGSGAFGVVLLARRRSDGREVAVKRVDTTGFDAAGRADAMMEISMLRKAAGHPNVVEILDSFTTKTEVFVVTEYCAGGDLKEKLEGKQHPPRHPPICFY